MSHGRGSRVVGSFEASLRRIEIVFPCAQQRGQGPQAALDQRQIYRACYELLVVTAVKLLWDGVSGYLV